MRFVTRWLRKRRHRARRELRLAEIEALGFELIRAKGSEMKQYLLRDRDGRVFDNNGLGWANSHDAYMAAKKLAEVQSTFEAAQAISEQ